MFKKPVRCTSCNFKGYLRIPKGQKVRFIRCPNCGSVTLR